jgi:hypothetical protein
MFKDSYDGVVFSFSTYDDWVKSIDTWLSAPSVEDLLFKLNKLGVVYEVTY